MPPDDQIADRIRGEYLEMRGLSLTWPQACRLWQIDEATCRSVLDRLTREQFLHQTEHGAYVALPRPRPGPARPAAAVSAGSGTTP